MARLALTALALAAAAAACSLAVDLDGLAGGEPDGGAPDAATSGGNTCTHATPPSRPPAASVGGDIAFTTALRALDLGESATAEEPVGLDVDRTCTCLGEGTSCVQPDFAEGAHCDAKDGVDNASAKVYKGLLVAGSDGLGSTFYSEMAEKGEWSLLFWVTSYNGELDDDSVTLTIYESPGMPPGPSGGGGAGGSMGPTPPSWNGQDQWPVSSASLVDGASIEKPLFTDPNAYVAGGVLVATVPSLAIRMTGPNSNMRMDLVAVTVMGLIEKPSDGLGYRITKGVMGGYWNMDKIFAAVGRFKASGEYLCNDGGFIYDQFKNVLCSYVDIGPPMSDPTATCDALSFGMNFETFPAMLGAVTPPKDEPLTCPPDQDPSSDTCD